MNSGNDQVTQLLMSSIIYRTLCVKPLLKEVPVIWVKLPNKFLIASLND
jgi:hypothetical protein